MKLYSPSLVVKTRLGCGVVEAREETGSTGILYTRVVCWPRGGCRCYPSIRSLRGSADTNLSGVAYALVCGCYWMMTVTESYCGANSTGLSIAAPTLPFWRRDVYFRLEVDDCTSNSCALCLLRIAMYSCWYKIHIQQGFAQPYRFARRSKGPPLVHSPCIEFTRIHGLPD